MEDSQASKDGRISEKHSRGWEENGSGSGGCGGTERVGRTRGPPGLLESALVSPVPIEERLAQTLGAGLMEPLQAALALQHFQVPPEGDTGLVTSRHSLLNCPTLLTTYSHPLQHSPHFIPWDSPTTTLCHSFVNPAPSLLTPQDHHSNSSSAAGCSDVQHPSPAPSVHMAETASYPAWLGHRGPSSVHPPSAEIEPAGCFRGVGQEKVGRGCGWEAPTGRCLYLGGDGKDALAADPGCALSLSWGWGPWNVAVLVIS